MTTEEARCHTKDSIEARKKAINERTAKKMALTRQTVAAMDTADVSISPSTPKRERTQQRSPGGTPDNEQKLQQTCTWIGIVGPLVGQVKSHTANKYGRWIQVDLLGRSGQIISIIFAYQVVQETGHHGDCTTHSQQVRMMRLEGQLQPNPRWQFILDMKSLVKSLYEKGNDLVLMGNFNESIGVNPLGMGSVMTAGHLTEAFCHRNDLSQEKPTYAQGTTRVDYILTSSWLLDYIQHTVAEPFNFRIFSNHRGLFVDFLYPGFFDRASNTLAKLHTRDLIYDCPQHVRKYLLATAEYFKDHKIEEQLIELSQGPQDNNRAESIDRDITRGMLAAEAQCKSTHHAPWSKVLHESTTRLHMGS
jgi:hypothetical protein